MIGWTRTTAIMKPLRRPERTPTASDAPMTETGSDHPFGTSTAATSALTRPASGPTERSMPPSPESTGAVCAIAMMMKGTAPTTRPFQLLGSVKALLAIALRMRNATRAPSTGQA